MHRRSQKPREVFAAEPELKIIMAFALMRLTPLIEQHLHPRTFNNRIGMGAQLAVNTLIDDICEVSRGYTSPCWLIKIDYKGYFPNMRRDYAWNLISEIVINEYHEKDKGDVLYCLEVACFGNPKHSVRMSPLWEWADYPRYKSVYCQEDGIGGFIGYTFWQMIASLYLTCIDFWVERNITPHFVRYVDDTVMVTDNKEAALTQIPVLREKLAEIGTTMHPKKFYCQPYQHGIEFLGYYIRPDRVHIKRKTYQRAMAVAKCNDRGKRNYIDAINSYLGMIKATSDARQATALLDAIHRKNIIKDYTNYKIIAV